MKQAGEDSTELWYTLNMALLHHKSPECTLSELDLFSPLITQLFMEDIYTEISPVATEAVSCTRIWMTIYYFFAWKSPMLIELISQMMAEFLRSTIHWICIYYYYWSVWCYAGGPANLAVKCDTYIESYDRITTELFRGHAEDPIQCWSFFTKAQPVLWIVQ